jgi:hypothetical protein
MKVLSKPDVSGWKMVLTCKDCLAELEVYGSDLKYHAATASTSAYDRGDSEAFTAKCIVCDRVNYINPSKIDTAVMALLRKGLKIDPPKDASTSFSDYHNR